MQQNNVESVYDLGLILFRDLVSLLLCTILVTYFKYWLIDILLKPCTGPIFYRSFHASKNYTALYNAKKFLYWNPTIAKKVSVLESYDC